MSPASVAKQGLLILEYFYSITNIMKKKETKLLGF